MALAISSLTLANGLRVVAVRDPRASEIQVTMRYAVGAVDDPPQQAGIAHLVEHLMFQQVVGAQSIFAKLEATAREFNATTSFDATTYVARAPVDRLDALLSIEAVRMGLRCTSITEAVFAREREVVVNELRMRDRSTEVYAALHRGAYPEGHPYAGWLGGTIASVGAISLAQACAFADAHYDPSNAVLVVSGNVEAARLETSLARFMVRIPRRGVIAPRPVPVVARPRAIETNAPFADDAVLFAWPLPADPRLRARLVAVGGATVPFIDALVKGRVFPLLLGDARAEMFAVVVSRGDGERTDEIIKSVEKAMAEAPDLYRVRGVFGEILFNRVQQGAIYQSFASLEEGGERDARLAAHVLAGRVPEGSLGSELASLRTLTPADATELATTHFAFGRATIAVLKASDQTRGSTKLSVATPVHDLGQRRAPTDPSEAKAAATEPLSTREPQGMTTRTLANGLRVILVPLTSVPTVDARIVFAAGTGDEPGTRRGAALVAARGLDWSGRHINDVLTMSAAGGRVDVQVDEDRIVYATQGLDMHIDYLLAGLRRLVRDGRYHGGAGAIVAALRSARKERDDEGALTDAWRRAVFGKDHPYTTAGVPRHVSRALSIEDAQQFRAAHLTPGNATIVISGRFDAALADRWIDYLFADWTGAVHPRSGTTSTVQPASIAKDDDDAQVHLQLALPAPGGTRAERLLAAAMLDEIVQEVRHQLGAAYALDAEYVELRRASLYAITGGIDAPRTHEAIALIKTRIEQLRADSDLAGRAFVAARRRVLAALSSTTRSAAGLAARVTTDVVFARAPLSDVHLAREVHQLTIDAMGVALADLDLARAAILMRGPAAHVDRAFAVLERTATRVTDDPDADAPFDDAVPGKLPDEERLYAGDIEDALTLQVPPTTVTFAAFAGYTTGKLLSRSLSGTGFSADGGLRLDGAKSVGLRFAYARIDGTYDVGLATPMLKRFEAMVISPSAFLQATAFDRLHGGVFAGVNFARTRDDPTVATKDAWSVGLSIGIDGGADVVRLGRHRLAAIGRIGTELGSAATYTAFSVGIGYRYD